MIRILYRLEAESDIEAAFDWYESRESGLGEKFRAEIEAAQTQIARSPLAFRAVLGNVRRCVLRRFPYLLLFVVEGEDIRHPWLLPRADVLGNQASSIPLRLSDRNASTTPFPLVEGPQLMPKLVVRESSAWATYSWSHSALVGSSSG